MHEIRFLCRMVRVLGRGQTDTQTPAKIEKRALLSKKLKIRKQTLCNFLTSNDEFICQKPDIYLVCASRNCLFKLHGRIIKNRKKGHNSVKKIKIQKFEKNIFAYCQYECSCKK